MTAPVGLAVVLNQPESVAVVAALVGYFHATAVGRFVVQVAHFAVGQFEPYIVGPYFPGLS